MEENDELSQLEELLCADLEEPSASATKQDTAVREINIFESEDNDQHYDEISNKQISQKPSAIHSGDTDSSDDEDRRNYTERKYNDYGSEVKKILDIREDEQHHKRVDFETRLRQTNLDIKFKRNNSITKKQEVTESDVNKVLCAPQVRAKSVADIYTDPVFGIRITKPLVSSTALVERMQGREAVSMLRVKKYVELKNNTQDWVIGGVIVRKTSAKKSQKGNQFLIWTLSDLKDDFKTVSMFLFRKAYNDLWKTSEGTVVAVLNPNILDRSENSKDQACLSVETSDRVMILGQSKDLGVCKSKKKNGESCTAFINLCQGDHCIYHVKQEYQKFSKRQELQSSTMGKGLVSLQNKVLGKSTVIYGGKAYSALPKGNNKKVKENDQNRLMSLSDYYKTEGDKLMMNKAPSGAGSLNKNSGILHSPTTQRTNDSDRLNKLSGLNSSPKTSSNSKHSPIFSPPNAIQSQTLSLKEKIAGSPKLGKCFSLKGSGTIDLNMSYGQIAAERAKANAVKLIQKSGGIQKVDPNNTKGTEAGKKRALDKLNNSGSDENDSKKTKPNEETNTTGKGILSERFKKILEATSIHQNLIRQHEDDEQEKYFNKLEKKEAMEEKMLNTFKLACKAVRCAKCKYTAFSAAQICKDERHPLKVLDTFKRFFKCADCGNRTVSLELIPLHSCGTCSGSRWEKAPMLREKKANLTDGLSIRGEEETFIGGHISSGKNINLLIPENE
ncbi:protein MCM10 homolog [Hyposmocoma kahamanoa]|uniref:protein MCM10 homolog n=1 Tax=Hyposmocoma kahamanoa TaxID=1477025 RepID=UPI000E6D9893|nr:protein MCM10 homolog [Hyposmocoma kahamanoa]